MAAFYSVDSLFQLKKMHEAISVYREVAVNTPFKLEKFWKKSQIIENYLH